MAAQSRPLSRPLSHRPARHPDRPPILITRPEPQATRFGRALRAADWTGQVFVSPLMGPVFPAVTVPPRPFAAIVLTSETGALAAARLPGLPRLAWCVGDRTAQVARAHGFTTRSARGDAAALAALIVAEGTTGPLLYLHGRETRGNLAEALNSAGIETIALLAYAQDPRPLTGAARRLIAQPGPVVLPILSPRTATLLVAAWQAAGAQATAHVVAMSPAVAEAARPLTPATLDIAARPDGDSLLAALRHRMESWPRA